MIYYVIAAFVVLQAIDVWLYWYGIQDYDILHNTRRLWWSLLPGSGFVVAWMRYYKPPSPLSWWHVQPGDVVTRWLAGQLPMPLKVTRVTADRIVCGYWQFDRDTGAEIDEDFDWGPPPKHTGSFLR